MIKIKKKGIQRIVSEFSYKSKWKALGFEIVEDRENEESKADLTVEDKENEKSEIDLTVEDKENEESEIDLTVEEIKEILDKNNIKYTSKDTRPKLIKLLATIE